jgi:hypothetical protein
MRIQTRRYIRTANAQRSQNLNLAEQVDLAPRAATSAEPAVVRTEGGCKLSRVLPCGVAVRKGPRVINYSNILSSRRYLHAKRVHGTCVSALALRPHSANV